MNTFLRLTVGVIAAAALGYVLAGPKTRNKKGSVSDERGLEGNGGDGTGVSGGNRVGVPGFVSGKAGDGQDGQLTTVPEPGKPVVSATVEKAE